MRGAEVPNLVEKGAVLCGISKIKFYLKLRRKIFSPLFPSYLSILSYAFPILVSDVYSERRRALKRFNLKLRTSTYLALSYNFPLSQP